MEIRFNTTNENVERALEKIKKNERKYFVEEAIVHYLKYLEVDSLATSLFLDVAKVNHVLEKENDDNNMEQINIQDEETEGNDNVAANDDNVTANDDNVAANDDNDDNVAANDDNVAANDDNVTANDDNVTANDGYANW